MNRSGTLLILGAGASYPYGLPIARELKQIIAQPGIDWRKWDSYYYSANSKTWSLLNQFRCDLHEFGPSSIDEFVETNKAYEDVARIEIARAILSAEDRDKLFVQKNGSWYHLISKVILADLAGNRSPSMRIVTFNYDRSLEFYVARQISIVMAKSFLDACRMVHAYPIFHVNGWMGNLTDDTLYGGGPLYSDSSGSRILDQVVARASKMLRFHSRENLELHDVLQSDFRNKKSIIFFGFGYSSFNLEVLMHERMFDLAGESGVNIGGTAIGLYDEEIDRISPRLSQLKKKREIIGIRAMDCEEFFRRYSEQLFP